MLFNDGVFCPEGFPDTRVRAALLAAAARPREVLTPRDLLLCAVWHGGEPLTQILSGSLPAGSSLEGVLCKLEDECAPTGQPPGTPRTRASFAPQALGALDDFEQALAEWKGALDPAAAELLLACVLAHLEEGDRAALGELDLGKVMPLLWGRVLGGVYFRRILEHLFAEGGTDGESDSGREDEPLIPPDLVPSEDMTLLARRTAADGPFPFDGEPPFEGLFESLTRALHRRRAHHVLLVGERGVGKGIVLAELARRSASGVLPSLEGWRFLRVDCRHLPPEDGRQRLAALLAHVAGRQELVLVLDNLAAFLRGDPSGGSRALLTPAPEGLDCRLIIPLTPREHDELFSGDVDLAEHFSRVEAFEPDPELALKILRRFAPGLAGQYQVGIDDEAVRQAVVLSASYVLNDQLPSKALKILHRACEDLEYERNHRGAIKDRVCADDIVRVVAEKTGVPEGTLRGIAEGADFARGLGELILGQDHAVREVAAELGLIKAGMTDPGKPASVMLFLGQTGTGKTETAKALARFYSTSGRLRTYTLGNCVEPHSVATIIGVPPGYVGHDQGGRLVNDLSADPYCVFLLDEADKAHPDVLQPFLNLFDEGWVADQRGVRAYADRAIFILTTNVGQRMMAEMAEQGKSAEEIRERMKEVLAQIRHGKADRPVFTPEFLARVKRIVVFNPLDRAAVEGITRKQIRELQERWRERRSRPLEVPEDLVRCLAERAHALNDKSRGKEGGRVVRKLISDWVEGPLQRAISAAPAEYRACDAVTLELAPAGAAVTHDAPGAPAVAVRFHLPGTTSDLPVDPTSIPLAREAS
jgi:ATP-dependent Clp protease ATP-binding subunit ClpA